MRKQQRQGKENKEWGHEAEQIAADFLITEGYTIRERNWRAGPKIEIDIIAEKDMTIIFVEVKARSGNFESAEEAVDKKKMDHMIRGANIYLQAQQHLYQYRFDIITLTGTKHAYTFQHAADAFMPKVAGTR